MTRDPRNVLLAARDRMMSLEADPSALKRDLRGAFRGGFAQHRHATHALLTEMLAELDRPDQDTKYDPWTWEAPDGTEHEAVGPVCPIRYSRGKMRPLMGDDGPIVDLPYWPMRATCVWNHPIRLTGKKT